MATTFLTERLMKAADVLIQHGECIEVVYCGPGERRVCRLTGRGQGDTVTLAVWAGTGLRVGGRAVRFIEVLLPRAAAERLEQIAREQEPRSMEVGRAMEFAARARQQRTRDGRFADCTRRAEPAGVR